MAPRVVTLVLVSQNLGSQSSGIHWSVQDRKAWTTVMSGTLLSTVQAFNSCIRRPDICKYLVVQTTIGNVEKQAKHINDPRSLRIKSMFNCEVIHLSMARVAIGHVNVYCSRGAHAFSAGINCQHCTQDGQSLPLWEGGWILSGTVCILTLPNPRLDISLLILLKIADASRWVICGSESLPYIWSREWRRHQQQCQAGGMPGSYSQGHERP